MSGLTDDDLDHIVERQHSMSLETDVDVGEIQIFPTGQLAWLKMCVKVPVMEEENSDDNDESGELAGCIIHVFLLIIQTVSFKIKCECHNKAKESQYDLNLLSGLKFCTRLHRNSMSMICHSNCSTYSPMRKLLHFHLSSTWSKLQRHVCQIQAADGP